MNIQTVATSRRISEASTVAAEASQLYQDYSGGNGTIFIIW